MATSGFYELEGGDQPALPTGQNVRIWKDQTTDRLMVLKPDGSNTPLSDIVSETELSQIKPDDLILVYDSVSETLKKITGSNLSPLAVQTRYVTYDEDDFITNAATGKLGWTATVSGTGASGQAGTYGVNGIEKALGVVQLDTGTTAAGRATLQRAINQVQLGYCSFEQVWRLAVEDLSTALERFLVTMGFIDNTGAGDHVDGVYFRYRDDLNGGQWQCVCRDTSVETVVNTSVVVNTSFNIFKIMINENATEAKFYINDTLVATINSNIPSTSGVFTGIGAKIEKSVGTTQRNMSIDYFTQKAVWSNGR